MWTSNIASTPYISTAAFSTARYHLFLPYGFAENGSHLFMYSFTTLSLKGKFKIIVVLNYTCEN